LRSGPGASIIPRLDRGAPETGRFPARRRRGLNVVDLIPEFVDLVRASRTSIDFKARFWTWVDRQRDLALGPLLEDMIRLWSGVPGAPSLADARALGERLLARGDRVARARRTILRHAEVSGRAPDGDLVLLAGFRRPEGYSRFDRGRNTIFLGLDHANSLAHDDHIDVILAHELTHAVRDPQPAVLADYGGWPGMSHDDFIARHPFREHLVSEGLATAVSERVWPGKDRSRYVFFDAVDDAWCDAHRGEIAARMQAALDADEDYRTFYARGSVTPDSPDCCDYWFGYHLARFALETETAGVLLTMPSSEFLGRFLEPFVAGFTTAPATRIAARGARPPETAIPDSVLPRDVRRFHAELADRISARPAEFAADAASLGRAVAAEGLLHAGLPYEVWPSPVALSAEDFRYLRWVAERLLAAIEKVVDLYRDDDRLREYFGFPPHLEQLARLDPGYRPLVPIGRFDAYWNGKEIRYLELNTNGTAVIDLADRIGPLFEALPHAKAAVERHGARSLALLDPLAATLLEAWEQASGGAASADEPRVAIVDWRGLPTATELERIRVHLEGRGLPSLVADPSELRYDGRRLTARGQPVDLVYRRLTLVDVLARPDELRPLFEASADGMVVPVGPFAADIAHSKRVFAALTHERWRGHFSPEERALIDAHVPWTRMFRPGQTLFGGRLRELRELALDEQDRMVLKPAEGQEGRDVVLGCELTAVQWEREVERRWGGDQVLQQRVEAPVRELMVVRDGRVETAPMHVHLGEYVFGGSLTGFLARASTSLVLSSRSDDRVLPVLVIGGEDEAERQTSLAHP
jgi:hypothetical protein